MRFGVVLIAAALVAACGHMSREELLMRQSSAFHTDVRWKRFNEAAVRVVPWKQLKFLQQYRDSTETLQIEDYELQSYRFPGPGETGYAEEPTLATLHMYRYQYVMPDVSRQKEEFREKWVWSGDGWFIFEGY